MLILQKVNFIFGVVLRRKKNSAVTIYAIRFSRYFSMYYFMRKSKMNYVKAQIMHKIEM